MEEKISPQLKAAFDAMPGCWGAKDSNSAFLYVNSSYSDLIGLKHHMDAIGMTDFDMPCDTAACAHLFQEQDKQVMSSAQSIKALDIHPFANNQWRAYIFSKSPLYCENGKIIGTIFHGEDITSSKVLELGLILHQLDLHNKPKKIQLSGTYSIGSGGGIAKLTERESEMLFFILRGKQTKYIAQMLKISDRTVEKHMESLKVKFSALCKADLVDCAVKLGYSNHIPERLFSYQLSAVLKED